MIVKNITDFLKNLFGFKPTIDEPRPIEPKLLKEFTVPRAPRHEPTPYGKYSDMAPRKRPEVRTHNSYNPATQRRAYDVEETNIDYVTPLVVGSIIAQGSYDHEDRQREVSERVSESRTYDTLTHSDSVQSSVPDTSHYSPSPSVSESSGSSYSSPSYDSGSSYSSGGSDSGGW